MPHSSVHDRDAAPRSGRDRLRQLAASGRRQLARLRHLSWLVYAGRRCVAHPGLTVTIVGLRLALPHRLRARPLDRLVAELGRARAQPSWPESVVRELTTLLLCAPSPWRTTCLFRALVRYALLAPHDPTVTFVIGLRTDRDGGGGHAWLERDRRPLVGEDTEQCVPTFSYPS